jgi:outer membrane receptor protein involved in Fe transport
VVLDVMKTSLGGMKPGDVRSESSELGSVNLSNGGTNAQILWTPTPRLSVAAGARYDYHNVYGGKASARLGLVLGLRNDLHLKLLYGGAFKAPSPQLLHASPLVPGDIAGNVSLKPAYVHTWEGQASYRPNRYVVFTTGVAYSRLLNQAEFVQRGLNQIALNVSQVESISWESELRLDYRKMLGAYANLAINRTVRKLEEEGYVAELTGYRNAGYPVAVANLGVSAMPPWLPLRLSGELSYVSSRASTSTNTIALGRRYDLPAYVQVGGTLRWTAFDIFSKKQTTLMLVARNLTNVRISDPGFAGFDYPQLGRTFMLLGAQEW